MNQSDLEVIKVNARFTGSYVGALLVFLPIVPIFATIISIVTFVVSNSQVSTKLTNASLFETVTPLLAGSLSTLLLWLLLAFFFRRFTSVQHANEQSYYALLNHLSSLDYYIDSFLTDEAKKASIDLLRRTQPRNPPTTPAELSTDASRQSLNKGADTPELMQEALNYRNAIYLALMQRSTSWVLGNGYIEVWDLMDSAEEALISFASQAKVIGDAVYDEMRLNDSNIGNSEEWANKLRSAVKALDADAVSYLKPAVGAPSPGQDAQTLSTTPSVAETSTPHQAGTEEHRPQAEARAILRKVKESINDYNTKNWNALISARNQLLGTMVMVGLTVYVLVEIATLIHANPLHIEVATIFALIGALAGLIGRMYVEAQSETAIDDYRLSMARLLVIPLLAALAAVFGVFVVAKVSSLDEIYTFKNFVANLIIAATFGLSPNLLLNQLQKKSESYKADLQSTQSTSGK